MVSDFSGSWDIYVEKNRSEDDPEKTIFQKSMVTPQIIYHSIEHEKLSNLCEDTLGLTIMVCVVWRFEWAKPTNMTKKFTTFRKSSIAKVLFVPPVTVKSSKLPTLTST